jgi:hypothetical protein
MVAGPNGLDLKKIQMRVKFKICFKFELKIKKIPHGRNFSTRRGHGNTRSTSPRKQPKKARPSSAHSRQPTLSLGTFSEKEPQV